MMKSQKVERMSADENSSWSLRACVFRKWLKMVLQDDLSLIVNEV